MYHALFDTTSGLPGYPLDEKLPPVQLSLGLYPDLVVYNKSQKPMHGTWVRNKRTHKKFESVNN